MKRRRTIIFIVGSLVAFAAVPSDLALASSLLSGYGGPGQGNQAILGSGLLNGPGGGGGGSGANVSASSAASVTAGSASGSAVRPGAASQAGRSSGRGSHAAASTPRSTAPTSIAGVYNAAERGAPAPSTGTLGLSGADLVLILLALGALALMAALTWRLTCLPAAGRWREGSGG